MLEKTPFDKEKFEPAPKVGIFHLPNAAPRDLSKIMKLAAFLRYLTEAGIYRLTDLSSITRIPPADLSNIIRGKRVCGEKNLEKLLDGIGAEFRPDALVAWLEDKTPEQWAHLVHILKAEAGESAPPDRLPTADTLAGAVEVLVAAAKQNPSLLAVIQNLARSFGG
jgi:hypothetical protein